MLSKTPSSNKLSDETVVIIIIVDKLFLLWNHASRFPLLDLKFLLMIVWTFEKFKRSCFTTFLMTSLQRKKIVIISLLVLFFGFVCLWLSLFSSEFTITEFSRKWNHENNANRSLISRTASIKISNDYWNFSRNNETKYSLSRSTFESWQFI